MNIEARETLSGVDLKDLDRLVGERDNKRHIQPFVDFVDALEVRSQMAQEILDDSDRRHGI